MKFKRFFLQFRIILGVLLAGIMVTAVYANYDTLHVYLSPGLVSGINHSGESLGGYDSHAIFEEDCTHCHAPVHCITDDKCQGCHLEIAQQRTETVGLHSLLPGTEKCQSCHIEHQGREVVISAVPFSNINHQQLSGFSLTQHEVRFDASQMQCEDCHTQSRFARDEVSCLSCHEDADGELIAQHSAEHGQDCLACHDGTGAIVEFDHSTVFALEGGHEDVACSSCHTNTLYAGTSQECNACHSEPELHAGQFGQECGRCHTAYAWAPAQLTQHRFELDHGNGEPLDCIACHTTTYTQVICTDCHESADMQALHPPETVPDYLPESACNACHPTGTQEDIVPLAKVNPTSTE